MRQNHHAFHREIYYRSKELKGKIILKKTRSFEDQLLID